ncbi:hypothetical protein [Ruminococcus sp. AM31-15AC]|uniref:hypothetical protein n=1 Tax=Ruminococcus sp. AM31-15AC TaxID=2293202 RepID=UPI000E48BA52|nr:hypothetical protein DW793_02000 [Ruminococcus sp. AM31-15AC]
MKTTGEDIFKALENADEHFIEECRQSGSGVKIKTVWKKWAAVAACGVFAAATGVMMFAGRSDRDIKAKSAADQQMADEEETVSYRVPWDEYAMNAKYETFEYNDVEYVSMGHVDKSFLDSKLTTMTLETENYETNKKETTKADIYSIKDLSPSVYLAVVFDDGSVAWYDDWKYSPDCKTDMTLDDIINDVSLEKTARVDYAYNDAGMGRLRKYTNTDLSKLLDLLKDDNGSYNAVYEGDAYESDPDINLSVTNDDEYYIEGGITISFYVERLDVNGTAYFTANGDLYVQLFAGDVLKFDIGGEKAEKLENWLNENCEYTDEKKNAEVAGDVDPSEKAVTSVAKDDSDMADEADIGYIDYFEDVGDNTFTTKDGRLTAKYSYEVSGGEFISHITYTNNWDKDMVLDFTTDQYITTEDSKGNSTSYGENGDRNTMNTLLKAGESYTEDYKTDIGADYVKGTAKITLIANISNDKNCNVVNYVTLKDIEIDFQ